jgi:hypothetical protein
VRLQRFEESSQHRNISLLRINVKSLPLTTMVRIHDRDPNAFSLATISVER